MTGNVKVAGIAYDVEAWASAEDGVGDVGSSRGSSPTPPAAAAPSVERPVPARVLLRLLRLACSDGRLPPAEPAVHTARPQPLHGSDREPRRESGHPGPPASGSRADYC